MFFAIENLMFLVALTILKVDGAPKENRDDSDNLMPSFEILTGGTRNCAKGSNLCLKVTYSDGVTDLISAYDSRSKTVLKGRLLSNDEKAVIVLGDEYEPKDTIVFKSCKTGGCTKFSVDLDASGPVTCLDDDEVTPDKTTKEFNRRRKIREFKRDPQLGDRNSDEIKLSPRELDSNGYKLNVMVYYDDNFKNDFGEKAEVRVDAIMAIVDAMFSEKDCEGNFDLRTKFEVNTLGIEHAKGSHWGKLDWDKDLAPFVYYDNPKAKPLPENDLSKIAKESSHDADLYVFITGKESQTGGGYAPQGSVCEKKRDKRVSISQYEGHDCYTATTVGHEMGHNLGMSHDFKEDPKILREQDGVKCKGYMDYDEKTDGWSPCNVADFKEYINNLACGFCLKSLGSEKENNKECCDADVEAEDSFGEIGCHWYTETPEDCGKYDNEEFKAKELCCACK